MFSMQDLMKKARELHEKTALLQEKLAYQELTGSSGGGMVRAVCNGKLELVSVSIDETLVELKEVKMLEDLITAAVNDGLRQAKELREQELGTLTGGLTLPGVF